MPTMIARPPAAIWTVRFSPRTETANRVERNGPVAPRHRVDQGQIAPAVALLEEQEIGHMQPGAADVEPYLAPLHEEGVL